MYFSHDKKLGGTMEVRNIDVTRKGLKQMMNVIKSKKKILFFTFLSVILLFGCNNGKEQSVADKLYKDLDAKETYEKAVEYFNENVTYVKYKQIAKDEVNDSVIIVERFNEGGKYNQITSIYNDKYSSYNYEPGLFAEKEVLKNGKASLLLSSDGVFKALQDINDKSYYESKQIPFFRVHYLRDGCKLLDISKEENGDHIVIKMKLQFTTIQFTTIYQISEFIIDSNGLFIMQKYEPYTDSTFEKKWGDCSSTVWYGDFNKKTTFDYEEERQKLKDLEGKDIDVIKDMFE